MFVFDLDGTLLDSIGDLAVAVNRLVAERGGAPIHADAVARMVGEGASLLLQRAFAAAGIPDDPDAALGRFLAIYDSVLPGTTVPYPGVPEMLQALTRVAPMAVLTNKPTGAAVKTLAMHGLDRFFIRIIGGDGPFPRKPHPDGLLGLAAEAGVGPQATWMIGDSTVDLDTAHAASARACIVRYGFGFAALDRSRLRGNEVFADRPADVAALLLGREHGH
jgi:phosphoglycolate phosphatase